MGGMRRRWGVEPCRLLPCGHADFRRQLRRRQGSGAELGEAAVLGGEGSTQAAPMRSDAGVEFPIFAATDCSSL